MTYLMKLMVFLLSGACVGGSLEAASQPLPPTSAVAAQCSKCPQADAADESDIDEDEDAVDRGDASDEDVLIMEEDEDSNASGVGN